MSKLLPLSAAQNLFDELMSRQPDKSGPKRSQATNIVNWYAIHREGKPFNDADRDDYLAHEGNRKTRVSEWAMVRLYLRNGASAHDTKMTRAARDTSSATITGKLLAHPSVSPSQLADIEEQAKAPRQPIGLIRGIQPLDSLVKAIQSNPRDLEPKRHERALYIAVMTGFGPYGAVYDDPDAKQVISEIWEVPELDRLLAAGYFVGGVDHSEEVHEAIQIRIGSGKWGYVAYYSLLMGMRHFNGVSQVTFRTLIPCGMPGMPPKLSVGDHIVMYDEMALKNGISTIESARPRVDPRSVDFFDRVMAQLQQLDRKQEFSLLS